MIEVRDKETKKPIGNVTEGQLQFLIDQLVEEGPEDQDYYINQGTLEMFEKNGADAALMALLRGAMGDRTEMEIEWERS